MNSYNNNAKYRSLSFMAKKLLIDDYNGFDKDDLIVTLFDKDKNYIDLAIACYYEHLPIIK